MKSALRFYATMLLALLSSGCLKFGDDTEFLAPNVTSQHLQQVTALTGIRFPEGSVGLAYLYHDSGKDPALAIKVSIPNEKKNEFAQNEIFQKGATNSAANPIAEIGWWKPEILKGRTDRKLDLPHRRFVECSLGVEEGKSVVYISWIST
jgi:hypothetical protein